jgi:hypothetical protein
MAMTLWNVTGHDSREALRAETIKLIEYLNDHVDEMDSKEREFMTNMTDSALGDEWVPSAKQLFWLRDLNVKY